MDPFSSRSPKHSLTLRTEMGLVYACVYQGQGLERVVTALCRPCSNPDLRRTEPILESPLQRTSSGSSSSSSTPSSQPSSQGGSQPGSQAGSSERTRVRGKAFPCLSLTTWPGEESHGRGVELLPDFCDTCSWRGHHCVVLKSCLTALSLNILRVAGHHPQLCDVWCGLNPF